jgi:hypothetical protein
MFSPMELLNAYKFIAMKEKKNRDLERWLTAVTVFGYRWNGGDDYSSFCFFDLR